MKRRTLLSLVCCLALQSFLPAGSGTTIDTNILQTVSISAPAEPDEPIKLATDDLRKYLGRITNQEIDVVERPNSANGFPVYLISRADRPDGNVSPADALRSEDSDAFRLVVRPTEVRIIGNSSRAVLYGAYDWLERLGCRWFGPHEEFVPSLDQATFTELDVEESPSLRWRGLEYITGCDAPIVDWMTKQKLNVAWPEAYRPKDDLSEDPDLFKREAVDEMVRRDLTIFWGGHILNTLFPPEKYTDHPEYFALVGGQRLNPDADEFGRHQLCTSNPEVMRILTENTIRFLQNHEWIDTLFIWGNDTTQWCECEDCLALEPAPDRESPFGGYDRSASYCRMIKIIYEGSLPGMEVSFPGVRDVLPGRKIAFNHYYNLESMPVDSKGDPLKDYLPDRAVLSSVDDYVQCNRHPLRDYAICPRAARRGVEQIAREWNPLYDDNVFWNYYFAGNFTKGQPLLMVHKIASDFQYARSLGIVGTIDNVTLSPPSRSSYEHWRYNMLNLYLYAKAAWNSEVNVDATVADVIEKYYGPAAGPMAEFWSELERATLHFGMHPDYMPDDAALTTAPAIHEWLWNIRYLVPNQPVYERLVTHLADARILAAKAENQPMKTDRMIYGERVGILQDYLAFWEITPTEERWTY
ncbi:MAG TPA: DUF4838 domain-containing protein [Candidatus Hydrogenedentes bacterium]|nr:DUF4838 domain-containing protein [Candidatus Hydrogenedentota bacterium]